MAWSTHSTRVDRATTDSARYTERTIAALLGAKVRALFATVAERVRSFVLGARAEAAGGVHAECERSSLPGAVSVAVAGHAAERQVEAQPHATAFAGTAHQAERRHEQTRGHRAITRAGAILSRQRNRVTSSGAVRVTSGAVTRLVQIQ